MSESKKKIVGQLSFSLDSGIVGKYGKVFPGLFDDTVNVSLLRIDTTAFTVDKKILWNTGNHPNMIRFYGMVEDSDNNNEFW